MHYFLGTNFKQKLTGIEKAQLNRLKIYMDLHLEAKCVYVKHNVWFYKHAEKFGVEDNCFTIYDYFQEAINYRNNNEIDLLNKWRKDGIYRLERVSNNRGFRIFDSEDRFIMYAHFHDAEYKQIAYINYANDEGNLIRRDFYDSRGFLNKIKYLAFGDSQQPFLEQYFSPNGEIKIEKYFMLNEEGVGEVQQIILRNYQGKDYFFQNENQLITLFINEIYVEGDVFYSDRHLALDKAIGDVNDDIPVIAILHSIHTIGMQTDSEVMTMPFTTPYSYVLENPDKYKKIVVSTEQQKEDILKRLGSSTPVEAIPVGFVSKEMTIDERSYSNNFKIISVARYSPEKQLDHQLRLIEKLKNEYPKIELHLFGFGDRRKINEMIKQLKLQKNVFIRGFQQDLKEEYESSVLSISTSGFEGFSLAIFESLAHGVPVISYDIRYGPRELITEGKNGFLVEPNNEDELYRKVKYFFDYPKIQKSLRHARKEFITKYSEEKIKEKWLSIVEGDYK